MKTKKLTLFFLLILGALIISACSGQPLTNNFPGLVADADRAYISTGSFIYAIDVQTGNQVWSYPEKADGELLYYANPVLTEDGQLLIGSTGTNHAFISLDPATGQEKWAEPFSGAKGAWVASPLVFNNTIYAPNTDGYLYTLDMNGKQVAEPIELGGALWSAPVTDGTYIYINSLDHHLHILNPSTGKLADPIDLGGAAPDSPAVGTEGIYVGSFESNIKHITSNGKNEVIASASDWIWGTPTYDNETLYYADLSGNIFSLDLSNNRQNWNTLKPDGPITASLLVVDDQIYVATEAGSFIALDRDGKIVWEKTPGGKIYTTPVLSNDLILVAPYQAEFALAAYDAAGKQAWTFTPSK
ncbi:MAG: PQQ-like beta-propeller repeat protein [Anaerolineales bacterium]|nr:PQQ-like beta-propeller repeat protein [Anaerolineales bacterium]